MYPYKKHFNDQCRNNIFVFKKKKKETFKKGTMNQVVHYLENRDINITWKI